MATRNTGILKRLDWFTILLYTILVILGWINIYAAVYNQDHNEIFDITQRYGKQMIWIFLAIIIIFVILILDSSIYSSFAFFIYGFMILSLISVLLFGTEVNSAKSWFEIKLAGDVLRIQPSEFAKFATGLALARFMSTYEFKMNKIENWIVIGLIIFLPSFLILLQPDTGSSIVYVVLILVLYREGLTGSILILGLAFGILFVLSLLLHILTMVVVLPIALAIIYFFIRRNYKELIVLILVFLISTGMVWGAAYFLYPNWQLHITITIAEIVSAIFMLIYVFNKKIKYGIAIVLIFIASIAFVYSVDYIFYKVLEPHQRVRISILLGVEEDLKGAGYNVHQSKIAIGSGGISGKGFLNGTQTKYNFVPEQDTDFIFCTVGEEWGFLGSLVVIGLFLTLFLRLIFLAERQYSVFSRVYGYCVASILFFHLAINIGMAIGLLPVIGIPLPFFSYGGSSLWSFTILLFIFLRLDVNREELL